MERGCVNNDYVIGSFTAPSQLQFRYSASVTRKISDIDGAYSWKEDTSCDKRQYLRYWSLFGYSAHRSLRHQRSDLIGTQFISNNELAFSSEPQGLLNVERWLLDLDYAESKSKHVLKSNVYNSVKDVLLNILPSVSGIRCTAGSGHFPRASVEFQTRFGWVSLNKLGHGYQAMIAWMVDFVSRLIERYPDSDDALSEPAICLIDEIDLHLHPVWQRKLISYLSVKFPNTQFIVTAHSPLVVQAAANADANIAVLVRSKEKDADGNYYVEIKNNPEDVKNWRLDQILTSDLFGGISLNPPEVEELFKEKEHLINLKRMKPEQKTRLAEIEEKIGKLPVGDDSREIKEMDAIREAIKVLKKRSAS